MTITPITPPQLGSPTPIAGFPEQLHSYTNITPFTYRSGQTYVETLEALRTWLRDLLVPHIDDEMSAFVTAWNDEIAALVGQLNTTLTAYETTVQDALDSQSTSVNASVQSMIDYVNEQVQNIINSTIAVTDPVTYGILNDAATATRQLTDGIYGHGIIQANTPTGTITYATLQAAATAAAVAGKKLVAWGTVTTDQTLTILGDADLSLLTYNYTGTGTAVVVGATGVAGLMLMKTVLLPEVINTNKTAPGWAQVAGTTGVRLLNTNACTIAIQHVEGFDVNVDIRGEGTGNVYNTIILNRNYAGRVGIQFTSDATGWANQNTIMGGSITMSSTEGNAVSGTRAVLMPTASNQANTNTFIGTSFEGNGWEYMIESAGLYNTYLNCRFEASLGAKVWWRATATRNTIIQGYGAITATLEAGAVRNEIQQTGRPRTQTASGTSVFNLQNDSSAGSAALTVADVSGSSVYSSADPSTTYAWFMSAQLLKGRRPADIGDRAILSALNGQLLLGNGSAAPIAGLLGTTTLLLVMTGTTVFGASTDGGTDLGGATGNRFNNARLTGIVKPGTFTTAARPTGLLAADNGALIYDSTLGKNIMWKSPNWVDLATGATV